MKLNLETNTLIAPELVGSVCGQRIDGIEHLRRVIEFSLEEGRLQAVLGPSYKKVGDEWVVVDSSNQKIDREIIPFYVSLFPEGFSVDLSPVLGFYAPDRPEAGYIPALPVRS
jgi:hypothetical protein